MATTTRAAGKRGALTGGALTEEALASSAGVLRATRPGASQRGLQQYFVPAGAAAFIKSVIDPRGENIVLDLTAGSGALLQPWPREVRFGIEIDRDWIKLGEYHAIHGDVQRAFPMLVKLGVRFPRIVCNPPFGLTWTGTDGRAESSILAAWRMALELLDEHGLGVFIAGRDRFAREILNREDSRGIIATIACENLFEGVTLPSVIAFYTRPDTRRGPEDGVALAVERDAEDLSDPELAIELRELFARSCTCTSSRYRKVPTGAWKLVDQELARRRREEKQKRPVYDIDLAGRERLSVRPKPFARQALARADRLKLVESLHNQPVGQFALNALDWELLQKLEQECELTIAPRLRDMVAKVAARAEREVIPLYELRPQMRLGYLTDLDSLLCKRTDTKRGFRKGKRYPLSTDSRLDVTTGKKITLNKDGEPVVRRYDEEARVLVIRIADHEFSESARDLKYILNHFDIPNPGDIATRFPEEVERQRIHLDAIAASPQAHREFKWKRFQREDLARALAKTREGGGVIVSWEQGGGKTIGAAGYALGAIRNGARNQVLFIVPQDLIPQYREDIHEKLGIKLEHITTPAHARRVAQHLAKGGEGWYVTHYEVLSLLAVKNERLPPAYSKARTPDGKLVKLHSDGFCPNCHASHDQGWQRRSPLVCDAVHIDPLTKRARGCGYVHKRLKVKPAAHHLSSAFRRGVICIDEGTLIKGDQSQRSKAIRGMRARNRLLATGTPISNYVNQIFWLMWWCIGDSTLRFPFSYNGGLTKFERDFCVIEYLYGPEGSEDEDRRVSRKVLPRITNVSRFWRLVAAGMVRRRKRDFGEPLVPLTIKTVRVPMGVAQRELYRHWLDKKTFAKFFAWKYPHHILVRTGQIERYAAACGQFAKLEYATTAPEAATDREWPGLEGFKHSNWTPKNLKTLEIILEHVQKGEKILVGSDLVETGRWLCERLQEKGVKASHIVEERGGKVATVNPRKRAKVMRDFRRGSTQVLLCGIPSIRLGHNLDTASVVVVDGLVFSYEMYDQFINRAHRLSSKKPVTVYVMLTIGSLDEDKWTLLCAKSAAADLGLDGQLVDEREDPISLEQVLRDMQARGVPVTGEEIDEGELKAAWEGIPRFVALAVSGAGFRQVTEGPAPMLQPFPRLKPIKHSEQLSLFG